MLFILKNLNLKVKKDLKKKMLTLKYIKLSDESFQYKGNKLIARHEY